MKALLVLKLLLLSTFLFSMRANAQCTRENSSVCAEDKMLPLDGLGDTVQVTGLIASAHKEFGDGDIHVIIKDSCQGTLKFLLAEIMPGTPAYAAYQRTRPLNGSLVSIKGLRYFDHEHGPKGMFLLTEHNHYHVEIHPVIDFKVVGLPLVEIEGLPAQTTHSENSVNSGEVVGHTAAGQPLYKGPRGGIYHYSKSGRKVYQGH